MALVQLGGGVTDIRGSIGGTTFSRGAGGNIARARKKPVNPRTLLQNARRAVIANLTKYWSGTLTEQQRTDWRAYASGTSWTNKLGQSIQINGLAAFVRLNALRVLGGLTIVAAAPTAMGHAGGVSLAFAAESDTTKLQLAEPTGAFDKDLDGHTLWIAGGIPVEAGHLSLPSKWQFIQIVEGDSITPPTFPLELTAPFTMAAGQRISIRSMFSDPENRVSGPFFAQAVAAPSA